MSQNKTVLFTANEDVAVSFLKRIRESNGWELIHLPLENYSYAVNVEEEELIINKLELFSFVIHGSLRNARYFMQWVQEKDLLERVQNIVHLVTNQTVVDFLDTYKIPAVKPRAEARPIDIIEFMLRISKEGMVLFPTTDQKDEEIPGLLQELDMPVMEFQVCKEESLTSKDLQDYRKKAEQADPDSIIFHSRSSVTRILTAFPDIDYQEVECISSGQAVSQKLNESNISPSNEARGSWRSLLDALAL